MKYLIVDFFYAPFTPSIRIEIWLIFVSDTSLLESSEIRSQTI